MRGVTTVAPAAGRSKTPLRIAAEDLLRNPMGVAGLAILSTLLGLAVLAPWILSADPAAIDYGAILQPPGGNYLFGTDEIGRSILARIVYGARVTVQIVSLSIGGALVLGAAIGLVAGYFGGWVDALLMRMMDALLAFPTLVLALGIIAILGPDLVNATLAIAIVNVPSFARLVRGSVLVVREQDYVHAARALGASPVRIMRRHLLPNVMGNVIVFASLRASTTLITESALSFLGLGVQPPTPSWGYMIAIGMQYWESWWLSFFPGLAIFVTVLGLNLFGDALRDVLDPRLRRIG